MNNLQGPSAAEIAELRYAGAQREILSEMSHHWHQIKQRIEKTVSSANPVEDAALAVIMTREHLAAIEVLRADYVRAREEHQRLQKQQ